MLFFEYSKLFPTTSPSFLELVSLIILPAYPALKTNWDKFVLYFVLYPLLFFKNKVKTLAYVFENSAMVEFFKLSRISYIDK